MESKVTRGKKNNERENDMTPVDEGSEVSGIPKTGRAVNARFVRVWRGPSSSSQAVTTMSFGDKAEILDRLPGYYKIRTEKGGHVGFVASNYFQED